ncbi:hypothetical protein DENSPDRAFT_841589 [Dentipellis sp. KUC8613]|nr:hypothetical protein DENSPDRAFT_841589 [Dentipellis sp. KUC8613]
MSPGCRGFGLGRSALLHPLIHTTPTNGSPTSLELVTRATVRPTGGKVVPQWCIYFERFRVFACRSLGLFKLVRDIL